VDAEVHYFAAWKFAGDLRYDRRDPSILRDRSHPAPSADLGGA
jgi:hypothetical protein